MVRNYTRKTQPSRVPVDVIKKAIDDVLSCGKSIRSVASEVHINPMTLCRYIQKAKLLGADNIERFGERTYKPVFTETQENILKTYLKTASNIYFGLSPKEVRILAFECAEAFSVNMPDSWKQNKSAGPDWFSGFMKRNVDLAIRTPEATSMSRATSFNRTNVNMFFSKLATVMDREKFQAGDIWNLDETGVTTVQKPRSVVATKGLKQIGSITSAERGELVTMCVAVSASGNTVPPMFIFPRVKYHDHFVRDGPVGCIGTTHPSGWMTHDNFLKFLKHFVKHTRASKEKKVLLLLDNHDSHLHIDILNFAKDNGVVMLSFPPHCSHKLQPLDRSVFGPFKRQLSSAQDSWMRNNPGKTLTIYDLPGIVKECWPRAATPVNIVHGFEVSGVHPFNSDVFQNAEFAPSNVTDRPDPTVTETPTEPAELNNHIISRCNSLADRTSEVTTEVENSGNESINFDAWQTLDAHVNNMNRLIIRVPGDGHCILSAVRQSLTEENIANLSHDEICFKLKNEIITNMHYYDEFAGDRDIVKDIENYTTKKEYNNDTIDLVLAALCNCLGVSAILYEVVQRDVQIHAQAPGRDGVVFRGDIHLAKVGENGAAHYNCVGRCFGPICTNNIVNNGSINLTPGKENVNSRFSPEDIRPHPKAPPRKGTVKSKKRRTAILTDTPEKNAIEEEFQKRQQRKMKSLKQVNLEQKAKPKEGRSVRIKPVQKKRKVDTSSDTDEEECYCLICGEPYSNSKSREKWIQCVSCKGWAHEACTAETKGSVFVCQNCESDYDSN